jgi:drug/metabolite transporter (DMT)-like permease
MLQKNSSSRIIFLGILLVFIQTFAGSSFDAITKSLGLENNIIWYHYYAIGLGFSLIIFIFYLLIIGKLRNHLIFENKKDYILPLARGITFIPIPIIIYYTLQKIPLNIFTPILMTTPFFVLIWSRIIQKEVIAFKYWLILIVGFLGTIFVAKPTFFQNNPFIYLIFLVAAYNALTSVIVSKYSSKASSLAYTFYGLSPLTIMCLILFIFDPLSPTNKELFYILAGGSLLFIAALLLVFVFHISGKYSRIIGPFFFTQLIWASLLGNIFFNETLDYLSICGLSLIVLSGLLIAFNTPK